MISVILIWLYALITVFLLGYGFATIWKKITGYSMEGFLDLLMAGIVAATVYAQFYSLIAPIGLITHLLLVAFCFLIFWRNRKSLKEVAEKVFTLHGKCCVVGAVALFFFMAYGTSKGYMHYDTALYHAQSIRWLEECGVVKGLGNLHCRLAYNSASFPLTALYGMGFLGGQSFHVMAGFLAWMVSVEAAKIGKAFGRKRLVLSDYGRIMAIYYLLIIYDEMVSPASDYFMVLTCFYLVIRWLSLWEAKESRPEPYGLLCILGVYLITVKLSAAVILLLTLIPAVQLIKEKKWKTIGCCLVTGILTALPYFIRNVVISGWLVYPFTQLDFFPVDWKIPKGLADCDAREIQVWGRGYTDVLQYDLPITRWFGNWFAKQTMMDKLFILASFAGVLFLVIKYIYYVYQYFHGRKPDKSAVFLLYTETVLGACFLFWVSTSPLIRYGCVYVWLTGVIIWAEVIEKLCSHVYARRLVYTLILLFGCYKMVMFSKELIQSGTTRYLVWQQDYDNYPTESYEIQGITFYKALEGDQTGYDPFPSGPGEAEIKLRGTTLEEGFLAQ